ncbi:MAG: DNA primase [Deltaproteobacteria bacterium]|jgi:DNA primase|nr:DNA primase [Deltaproteobacteria bacterium]
MGRIPDDKIQEVRDRTDIVEVVSGYLPLKRSGANHLGLCPFHQEKTPSFNVNAARQIFHCFGCGVGGNVFTFLMRMDGISFPDAVKRLAERAGVEVVEDASSPEDLKRRALREQLFQINHAACDFYHHILMNGTEGSPGRRYLRRRGYAGQTVQAFQVGFAPEEWERLARHLDSQGFQSEAVLQTGLCRHGKQGRGHYDLFRNRLLFPIHDAQGRCIAFGGRVLDDSLPKYINSPESPIYHKSETLYGLYQAKDAMRQLGQVFVVEGYFDVLALNRAGFANSVATCGTALTNDHARLLKRFADKVSLVFDEDDAGQKATYRAMDALLPAGLSVEVVRLPAGADPDALLQRQEEATLQDCLDNARPVLEVFMEEQLEAFGPTVEGRVKAADEVLSRLRKLPNELERSLYVKTLAERTGLDEALLLDKTSGRSRPVNIRPSGLRPGHSDVPPSRQRTAVERAQTFLLGMMLQEPTVRQIVRDEGLEKAFPGRFHAEVAEQILSSEHADGSLPDDLVSPALSESAQALLARLMLDQTISWAENQEQLIKDCLQTIRDEELRRRYRDLPDLIRAAEEDSDWATHAALLREYQGIKKGFER